LGTSPHNAHAREWPADTVERWAIEKLIPYAKNARTHSDAQVAQIAASMKEWGWTNPVLADEAGGLISGHGRVLAARQLGITEVPVMIAHGWTEAQKRAYVIAGNKLALNAGWDGELLRLELGELKLGGFDLSLTGFGDLELKDILAEPEFAPGSASDQHRLDEKTPCTCPNCGFEFVPESRSAA
jgi:ParB-like chromosome segregation protein Spo0J